MHDPPSSPLPIPLFHVLLALHRGPMHGYGIKKAVAERSGGRIELDPGGLYRMIARLEEREWAEPVAPPSDEADARRKYYALTPQGAAVLSAEARRLWDLAHEPDVTALVRRGRDEGPDPERA